MKDAVLETTVIHQEMESEVCENPQEKTHGNWLRVRPTLRRLLAVAILALVALIGAGDTPHAAAMADALLAVGRVLPEYTQHLLNGLAALAVFAVFCRAWRKPRVKQVATA